MRAERGARMLASGVVRDPECWESFGAGDVMSGPVGSGEAHAGVLPEWFGPHWWTGRDAVLVAAAVILLPLVLQKHVGTYPAARIEHSCLVRDRIGHSKT